MDIEILRQVGLSEVQAKIYLFLIEQGQQTATEIANGVQEHRTTVYSAVETLCKLKIIAQEDRGKIAAYVPKHPAALEALAEKRLRVAAKQAKNLESNLPSLINYYNENQQEPGVATFYGEEGIERIRSKVLEEGETFYFVRSRFDELANHENLTEFKKKRVKQGIKAEDITPSEFASSKERAKLFDVKRTLLPPNEYDSPVEIDIFGDVVAFVNYKEGGMSTVIESPEIADAMRQFFKFAQKYIRKATNQDDLIDEAEERLETREG